ncbi:hypothetical protein HPB50_000311 [Hyalomma asiaticum]|uniref:Uncharacterized protein n=1 Tax=Hyalomma asiaticum TaxID=266040 RepID=A0ACB7RX60_HYAAI|nr:hypothetical protein HPB50_000311 [Hyalomma asiaticum]
MLRRFEIRREATHIHRGAQERPRIMSAGAAEKQGKRAIRELREQRAVETPPTTQHISAGASELRVVTGNSKYPHSIFYRGSCSLEHATLSPRSSLCSLEMCQSANGVFSSVSVGRSGESGATVATIADRIRQTGRPTAMSQTLLGRWEDRRSPRLTNTGRKAPGDVSLARPDRGIAYAAAQVIGQLWSNDGSRDIAAIIR